MRDRIELESDWCANCGQMIEREPFQPDPTQRRWIWQWTHQGTGRTGCDKVLFAEPGPDYARQIPEEAQRAS